jgi:hypothetical protein
MKEEMDSLVNNQTWDLVQLPAGKRALQNKWAYKLKEEEELVWPKASSKAMVFEFLHVYDITRL